MSRCIEIMLKSGKKLLYHGYIVVVDKIFNGGPVAWWNTSLGRVYVGGFNSQFYACRGGIFLMRDLTEATLYHEPNFICNKQYNLGWSNETYPRL
jgi:hypothetical protein